jgi:hypothetical protein
MSERTASRDIRSIKLILYDTEVCIVTGLYCLDNLDRRDRIREHMSSAIGKFRAVLSPNKTCCLASDEIPKTWSVDELVDEVYGFPNPPGSPSPRWAGDQQDGRGDTATLRSPAKEEIKRTRQEGHTASFRTGEKKKKGRYPSQFCCNCIATCITIAHITSTVLAQPMLIPVDEIQGRKGQRTQARAAARAVQR